MGDTPKIVLELELNEIEAIRASLVEARNTLVVFQVANLVQMVHDINSIINEIDVVYGNGSDSSLQIRVAQLKSKTDKARKDWMTNYDEVGYDPGKEEPHGVFADINPEVRYICHCPRSFTHSMSMLSQVDFDKYVVEEIR